MEKLFEAWRKFLKEKTSGEIFQPERNEPVEFDAAKVEDPEFKHELFNLIQTAYRDLGGHAKYTGPESVGADAETNYWVGTDIHNDPDFDVISFGHKGPHGIKFSGVGHDGSKTAIKKYLDSRGKHLSVGGHYAEVSGRLAQILIGKYNVPIVNDEKKVRSVLKKNIKWVGANPDPAYSGEGWYYRSIGGKDYLKLMVGKPV